MAHVKILSPTTNELLLSDLLGPLPKKEILPVDQNKDSWSWALSQVRGRLEEGLRRPVGNLTMVLPPGLIENIADNVIQVAMDEPCGLRGSVLRVTMLEEVGGRGCETAVMDVKADLSTPTTHVLDVVLRPDASSWYTKMAYIFRSFSRRRVVLSPKYELRKTSVCSW